MIVGFVLTFVEVVKNLALSYMFHYQQPWVVLVASLAFNLLLGVFISFMLAGVLPPRRWFFLHGLVLAILVALIYALVPFPLGVVPVIVYIFAGLVVPLHVGGLFIARSRFGKRWFYFVIAGFLLVACLVPYWMAPVKWDLDMDREAPLEDVPNILMIVMDTVRSDRLDLMGYERSTFPWLTKIAAKSATFERAISAAPWTMPAHASIFTGTFPSTHGVHHENTFLAAANTTLAEVLYANGWDTVAMSANPWLSKSSGMTQGFAEEELVWKNVTEPNASLGYRVAWNLGFLTKDHSGRQATDSWLRWISSRKSERPFFAFLNYIEPHFPYHQIPRDYLSVFAAQDANVKEIVGASRAMMGAEAVGGLLTEEQEQRVRDLYDSAIFYEGELIAEAVEALDKKGVADQTILVIVSDHGELLGEHDMFTHNRSLAEQLLSVPLVIRYTPRIPRGMRVSTPVTTSALMPTILDMVGLPVPDSVQTRSFAPLFEGNVSASISPLLSESFRDKGEMLSKEFKSRDVFDRLNVRYRSLEEDGWKLITDSEGYRWLFRPREDPEEMRNLIDDYPDVAERLSGILDVLVQTYGLIELDADSIDGGKVNLDPAAKERLRALGYIG